MANISNPLIVELSDILQNDNFVAKDPKRFNHLIETLDNRLNELDNLMNAEQYKFDFSDYNWDMVLEGPIVDISKNMVVPSKDDIVENEDSSLEDNEDSSLEDTNNEPVPGNDNNIKLY